jgi:hypothetical protein
MRREKEHIRLSVHGGVGLDNGDSRVQDGVSESGVLLKHAEEHSQRCHSLSLSLSVSFSYLVQFRRCR